MTVVLLLTIFVQPLVDQWWNTSLLSSLLCMLASIHLFTLLIVGIEVRPDILQGLSEPDICFIETDFRFLDVPTPAVVC